LTTCSHQPIPDPTQSAVVSEALRFPQRSIISPSLSSAASRSDEADAERRRELSPSPEVDLSSPELDDVEEDAMGAPLTPTGSFSGRLPAHHTTPSSVLVRNHRAASPPLEKDEKEFTQTARGMQKRKLSEDSDTRMNDAPVRIQIDASEQAPVEVEDTLQKNMEVAAALFGKLGGHANMPPGTYASSPMVKPSLVVSTAKPHEDDLWAKMAISVEWDMRSPEHIELDELDDLLDDF